MTAEVIAFPKSKKELELQAMKEYVDKAKLVIARNIAQDLKNYSGPNIHGVPVQEPKTRADYLELCKQFLEPEDYKDILCGIMDKEHYDGLEDQLQHVIESYFSFKK